MSSTPKSPIRPPGRRRLWAFFLPWTLLTLMVFFWLAWRETGNRLVFVEMSPDDGSPVDNAAGRILLWQQVLPWIPWLLLAPYVLLVVWRHPFSGLRKGGNTGILLVAGIAFTGLCLLFQTSAARRQPIVVPMPAVEAWFPPGMDLTPGGDFGIPLSRKIGLDPQVDIPYSYGLPPGLDPRKLPGRIMTREEMKQRISQKWRDISSRSEAVLGGLPAQLPTAVLVLDGFAYLALTGFSHAWIFLRTAREENRRAALLDSQHVQARARALQAQLQPHFLFNTLNGIATLTRRDPEAAEEMIVSLSDLMRIALDGDRKPEIPLREELHFVDRYLEIQRMRFGDRLQVVRRIDPATLDFKVPALLIQPLVENAIQHGIEPSNRGGTVQIRTSVADGMLEIGIEDDGDGLLKSSGGSGSGIGLKSIRERLEALHPGRHHFIMNSPGERGARAVIRMPAILASDPT
ncbi:sensor histidine kinase [Luteolibacter marinus]|uniref:sensor histidine kinase n=1 Tax=Luteolibacter marinus TaxID=2776705 RepID=UPI0018678BDE|nr:histidine kinase [Luteolibacter marinus]